MDRNLAKEVLINLANGAYNNSQIAAFLTVFTMRSVTVEELSGFKDAMLELCIQLPLDDYEVIDLCGTGGDSKDSFNISTLSSFVVAGAGKNVAKHGNYGVSSVCGSSNLMNYFGYEFTNERDQLLRDLDNAGICFLHAPLFHPAMKNVAPIRKELGSRLSSICWARLVNPSQPKNQLVGVFSLELARLYGYIYQQTDKRYSIIHSLDGYDEVSLTGPLNGSAITRNLCQSGRSGHVEGNAGGFSRWGYGGRGCKNFLECYKWSGYGSTKSNCYCQFRLGVIMCPSGTQYSGGHGPGP